MYISIYSTNSNIFVPYMYVCMYLEEIACKLLTNCLKALMIAYTLLKKKICRKIHKEITRQQQQIQERR